jgi:predicted  nucleic acid-binding Zn-ribbon protein
MATDTEVLDFLRVQFARVHERLDSLDSNISDLNRRVTALELSVAQLHGDFARQSLRLDAIELRLDRIERRLALPEASS